MIKLVKPDSVKVTGSRYSLSRVGDGVGDSGGRLEAINPLTAKVESGFGVIKVGFCVLCGSIGTRTFGNDFWLTTPVTEILEIGEDNKYVKFKTKNSVYEVRGS